jgi:K+-sensing histidine kinase KdpD
MHARQRVIAYVVSAAIVAVVAALAWLFTRFVALPHVSILFMAAVLTSAVLWGFWPAVFSAVLSVATSMYFFYSPIFDFRVADVQDIADLAVFVIVAALTSRLAAGVRAQALEARRQERNLAGLLAFSERVAAATSEAEVEEVIARQLAESAAQDDADYRGALLGQAALARERARLRRELADARVRRQGETLRDALLNSVSHDLRTPLAAILGSATALESLGDSGQARAELAATIREEAERLESYIDNVLDLTRIRAGEIAPRPELVELSDIVNAALHRRQNALAAHQVEVELPPDLPMLRLDLFLMEHALANVLDNAARYSPPGSRVRVRAARHNGEVTLEIADAGRGIAQSDLPRVFDPFYRGASGDDAPPAGTGLGLAICRAFVEANGGAVEAASAGPGAGTVVRLRLPVPRDAAAQTLEPDDE